jgi:hypothetical protein
LASSEAGSGTSSAATQVCTRNRTPASSSAANIALPMDRADSRFSSASIEMPSKPRNDSTAIDTAPNTTGQENVALLYSGAQLNPCPLPCARATTPTTRKISSTSSSPTNMTLFTRAVISMPR